MKKYKCTATIIRNDKELTKFTDLCDVRCNEGYIVFVNNDGKDGVIFLPKRGDMIRIDGEEVT